MTTINRFFPFFFALFCRLGIHHERVISCDGYGEHWHTGICDVCGKRVS